jgi:hypothetical protein
VSTLLAEGATKVSKSAATVTTFWMALVKVGCYPPPPHGWPLYPLCIEHRLAVVLFSQLSLNGLSLADVFAPSLCGPVLDVRI